MKGSTFGNLKTHVQRHHIGKGATTPFFPESRRGTHSAQEVQQASGKNLFSIHFESILNLFGQSSTLRSWKRMLLLKPARQTRMAMMCCRLLAKGVHSCLQRCRARLIALARPENPMARYIFEIDSESIPNLFELIFQSTTLQRSSASGSSSILEPSALSTREGRTAVSNLFRIYSESILTLYRVPKHG
jgi:hypothetical protein